MEVSPLNLSAEHFPVPCTLRELVLDRYDDSHGPPDDSHAMAVDELLGYLKNIDNFEISPALAIQQQTEAIGDPAVPANEHTAILRWLGHAMDLWEKHYPLEEPLASQVRRLKPLIAAVAITDPHFLQPGDHLLHQMLDTIQARAIGWQSQLGRVGSSLEQQITKAVAEAREWFEDSSTDLDAVYAEFSAAAQRDQSRAQRMTQRVVETEMGKVRTSAAKQEAARMINLISEKYQAPTEIGEFITGPWYSSAQLLILKFGGESEQWQKMASTTETLLDSLQNLENAPEERRQHIFRVVTQLPKEMRRWLLSLHHDTEAVNEAMGLIEFAHLRILRRQELALEPIPLIRLQNDAPAKSSKKHTDALSAWEEGQWCKIATDNQGMLRAQLALKADPAQELLFTNLAGIKVLQISYAEFASLVAQKRVSPLSDGASFSICLTHAAGIKSVEMLEALIQTQMGPDFLAKLQQARVSKALETTKSEAEAAPTPKTEPGPGPNTTRTPETKSAATVEAKAEPQNSTATEQPLESDEEPAQEQEAEMSAAVDDEAEALEDSPESQATAEPTAQQKEAAATDTTVPKRKFGLGSRRQISSPKGFLLEQVAELKARGGFQLFSKDDPGKGKQPEKTPTESKGFLTDAVRPSKRLPKPTTSATKPREANEGFLGSGMPLRELPKAQAPAATDSPLVELPASVDEQDDTIAPDDLPDVHIDLPTGTWLGFHDKETPMMARLAVHDPSEDQYIFVNRKGVKMRQMKKGELLDLIERGLVDIVETKSNFRDEVMRARKELDD